MASVEFAVVGHPARREMAEALAAELHAALFVDDEGLGEWANHARAWRWVAASGAEWGCVVQDDAVPVRGFVGHVRAGLEVLPEPGLVSWYLGTSYPVWAQPGVDRVTAEADASGASWIRGRGLLHGVAVSMRCEWVSSALRVHGLPYDQQLGWWAARVARVPTFYAWPSLVDHADVSTVVEHADGLPRVLPRVARAVGVPVWSGRVAVLD